MEKIEEILAIDDKKERQSALTKTARSIGIDPHSCQNAKGEWNEEKLVIQIYDALQKKKKAKKTDINFVGIGIGVAVIMVLLIGILPKVIISFYENEQAKEMREGKTLQGFTEDGKPAFEDGQPVLFKAMEGAYEEYDKDGNLVSEHLYKNGELISTKTFDRNGKVIKEEKFPQ